MVAGVVDRHTTPRTSRMDSKDCQTLVVFLQILVLDQTQKDTRATISVTTPLNLGDSVVSAVDRSASKAAPPPCPRCTDPGLRLLSLPPFTLLLWDTSSPCGFIFYSSQSSLCLPPPSGSSYVLVLWLHAFYQLLGRSLSLRLISIPVFLFWDRASPAPSSPIEREKPSCYSCKKVLCHKKRDDLLSIMCCLTHSAATNQPRPQAWEFMGFNIWYR